MQRVALYEPLLNRQYGVIKMKKVSDIEPWDAMYALLGTRVRSKIIVAVDEDIDPEDPMAVNWAIVNRSQPHRDMRIIQPRPLPHGPLRFWPMATVTTRRIRLSWSMQQPKVLFLPSHCRHVSTWSAPKNFGDKLELPTLELKNPWFGHP